MKIINNKKIFSFALTFLLTPFFLNAQTFSTHIQDVQWEAVPEIFSVSGGGVITTDVPYPSFRWQIEYGFAGEVTTNPDGTFNVSGPGIQYVPMDINNLFTSGPAHLTPISSTKFSFNFPVNFQNTLWPATRYYFDIVEWHQLQGASNPVRDYLIIETEKLQSLILNVDYQPGSQTIFTLQVPSSENPYNQGGGVAIEGMPVAFYILSEERPGQGIEGNEDLVVWAGAGVFDGAGSITISVPLGANLDPSQFYYVKLINDQPGAGQLPLLFEDLVFLLDGTPEEETGGGGSNPGFPASGEEFENGLITCDESPGNECNFEKLLLAVNKIIRFIVFVIGIPIVTLVFAYAGFLMVTSGGNPSKKDEAKSLIGNAVVGLIVLLGAWIIVRTVLVVFGYTGPLLGILGA